jgi:hypothetical protein
MPMTAIVYGQAFAMFEGGRQQDNMVNSLKFMAFFCAIGVIGFTAAWATVCNFKIYINRDFQSL